MPRGELWLAIALLSTTAIPSDIALAASQVETSLSADGTVLVVGSGWRPNQQLEVSVGPSRLRAYVDSGGGFEVATGLAKQEAGNLSVHHPESSEFAISARDPPAQLHPLAILFAQSVAIGAVSGVLGAAAVAGLLRAWRATRLPRR